MKLVFTMLILMIIAMIFIIIGMCDSNPNQMTYIYSFIMLEVLTIVSIILAIIKRRK